MNGRKNRTPSSKGRENLTRLAVSAALLSLAACGGGGTDDSSIELSELQGVPAALAAESANINAETDVAETVAGNSVTVSILQNDNFEATANLQLVGQPANGTAKLLANGDVEYVADANFEGTDSVDYVLIDAQGEKSTGTLYIAVVCADCTLDNVASAPVSLSGEPLCESDSDADGDGYGWENNATCEVPRLGAALSTLSAKADSLNIAAGAVKTIAPLRNDSITDRASVQFAIDVPPSQGRIEAVDSGIVVYAAPKNFSGTDSMVYSIKDASGDTSVASIDFHVSCDSCVVPTGLLLSWPANSDSEAVDGYRVFFGPDENSFTSSLLSEVSVESLNGSAPNAIFDITKDLNVSGSEGGCFRVQAYRGAEESEQSDPVCFSLG